MTRNWSRNCKTAHPV